MLKIIHFVQNLSLDITSGAVVMTLFLAKVFDVVLSPYMLVGLAIAIWLIYTIDHLLDARKSPIDSVNPRHAFHQKYFKQIVGLSLLVFAIGLWNLGNLPEKTLLYGFVLATLSGLYLVYSFLSKKPIRKEIFAAFVYAAGVSVAPLSLLVTLEWDQLLLICQIFALAYANLLIIPLYEYDIDIEDHHASMATLRGASMVKQRVLLMCSLSFILVIAQFILNQALPVIYILLLMTFVLFTLINRQDLFRKYQLYRILADGIFFLPGLYLIL